MSLQQGQTKPAPPGATDVWEARVVATATRWAGFIRIGVAKNDRVEFDNLPDLIRSADRKARETGKTALLYAIEAEGHAVMVGSIRPGKPFVSAVKCALPIEEVAS